MGVHALFLIEQINYQLKKKMEKLKEIRIQHTKSWEELTAVVVLHYFTYTTNCDFVEILTLWT